MLTNNSILNYRKHTKKSRALAPGRGTALSRRDNRSIPGDSHRQLPGGQRALRALIAHLARSPGFFIAVLGNWLIELISELPGRTQSGNRRGG